MGHLDGVSGSGLWCCGHLEPEPADGRSVSMFLSVFLPLVVLPPVLLPVLRSVSECVWAGFVHTLNHTKLGHRKWEHRIGMLMSGCTESGKMIKNNSVMDKMSVDAFSRENH